jgi:uncharacterized protein YecE (DUF72 family)
MDYLNGVFNIGTSGLSDMSWKRYMENRGKINSLEINSSFYRNYGKDTWKKWYDDTPEGVSLSLKVWKKLTHEKRLSKIDKEWGWFWEGPSELKEKLGVVLFQFPPTFRNIDTRGKGDNKTNLDRLKHLAKVLPTGVKFAFEFRDTSWYVPEVIRLLEKNNWCLVNIYANNKSKWIGDLPLMEKPVLWPDYQTANFCYTRLHGSLGKFRGYYTREDLMDIIKYSQGDDNYVYFNNSFFGTRGQSCLSDKDKKIYSCSYCNAIEFSELIDSGR